MKNQDKERMSYLFEFVVTIVFSLTAGKGARKKSCAIIGENVRVGIFSSYSSMVETQASANANPWGYNAIIHVASPHPST